MLRLLLLLFLISSTYGQYQNQYQAQTRAPPRQSQPYHYPNHSYQQQQQPQQSQRVQVVHHTPQNLFSSSTIRPTHPTHNTHYTTHQQQQLAAQQHQQAVQQHQQNVQQQKVKPYTPAPTAPARLGGCNVPPDYWCDSYEIAQRCDVVKQCENFKLDRRPITVTLMYEALCPFCQKFISNHLGNLYNNYQGKIELELVPWGNSRLLSNGQISCNHGQTECDANRLMSCVVDVVKTKQAIPFIVCFERQLTTYPQVEQAMHHCSTFISNAYREIRSCYSGERGRQLQRQAAYRTMNMRAHPINEVPYIVINNYSPSNDVNGLNIMTLQHQIQKWLNMKRQ